MLSLKIIAVLFGALWRFWDGLDRSQSRVPTVFRGLIFFGAALAVCKMTGKPWMLAAYMASAATLNIIVGHTEWKDWQWQSLRFSTFAALTVLPLNDFAHTWPYLVACSIGGLAYPVLFYADGYTVKRGWPAGNGLRRLPRWGNLGPDPMDAEGRDRYLFDGPEAYARLPLGAAILGGLAFV